MFFTTVYFVRYKVEELFFRFFFYTYVFYTRLSMWDRDVQNGQRLPRQPYRLLPTTAPPNEEEDVFISWSSSEPEDGGSADYWRE